MPLLLTSYEARPPWGLHLSFGDGSEREVDLSRDLGHLSAAMRTNLSAGRLVAGGKAIVWPDGTVLESAVLHGDALADWGHPLHFRALLSSFQGLLIWVLYGDDVFPCFQAQSDAETATFQLPTLEVDDGATLAPQLRRTVAGWAQEHLSELTAASEAASKYVTPTPVPPPVQNAAYLQQIRASGSVAIRSTGSTRSTSLNGKVLAVGVVVILLIVGAVVVHSFSNTPSKQSSPAEVTTPPNQVVLPPDSSSTIVTIFPPLHTSTTTFNPTGTPNLQISTYYSNYTANVSQASDGSASVDLRFGVKNAGGDFSGAIAVDGGILQSFSMQRPTDAKDLTDPTNLGHFRMTAGDSAIGEFTALFPAVATQSGLIRFSFLGNGNVINKTIWDVNLTKDTLVAEDGSGAPQTFPAP